tara:strand:+ start:829 stop:1704 length:876 start_codon:yes stop_codon:yes gene_type:complete
MGALICCFLPVTATARNLVIGSISDNPVKEIRKHIPLARYLAGHLADEGITGADVYIGKTISDIADAIKSGEIDLFVDSSLVVQAVHLQSHCSTQIRRWKKGHASYHSVLFTRSGHDLEKLSDLRGHNIAFDEPSSTSGYLLPRAIIENAGLTLKKLPSPGQSATSERLTTYYDFSDHDENTLAWVLYGRMDAGAMSNIKLERLTAGQIDKVKIFHKSPDIPHHLLCVNDQITAAMKNKIIALLKDMSNISRGRKILKKYENTKKFDDIPEDQQKLLQHFLHGQAAQRPAP